MAASTSDSVNLCPRVLAVCVCVWRLRLLDAPTDMLSLTICVRCRFYDAYAFHANFLRLLSDNQVKSCTEQKDTPDYTRCTNKANQHATL